jgi:hypothetical protein
VTIDRLRAGDRAGMVTVVDTIAVLFISPSRDSLHIMSVPVKKSGVAGRARGLTIPIAGPVVRWPQRAA